MTGPISFRPTTPTATPTTSTPIQRSAPLNPPPAPPPPPPVRSPQAFQRSAAASGSRPLDLQAEAASINTAITQANPEQIQANAARLNQLGLVPQGMPGITPEALQTARQNLKPVSQHQVLNVHDAHESDTSRSTVVESGRSVKLKQGGSPFGVGIVLKPGATVEVLGHGSPDGKTIGGKTPQQLAKQLKAGGATQLAVLDLKSCHSEAFKAELQQCLDSEGIQVGQIKTYQGNIAVDRATGNALSQQQILASPVPIEHDGFLPLGLPKLIEQGYVSKVTEQGNATIVPFKQGFSEVSDEVVQKVKETVGVALDKVMGEIKDGSFISKLEAGNPPFPGHLLSLKQHVGDPRHESLLIAGVGYLIEDRVTQVLITEHSFSADSFQQTVGKTRPDIVMPHPQDSLLSPKKPILVDLTAANSAGHILGKDPRVWFAGGQESLEVVYPSFTVEFAKRVINSAPVDTAKLQKILETQAQEAKAFKTGMQSFLNDKIERAMFQTAQDGFYVTPSGEKTTIPVPEDLIVDDDGFIRDGENRVFYHKGFADCGGSKEVQLAFVAKQVLGDVDQSKAKLKHAIIKYGATASFVPSAQRTGLVSDQATRAFDILFQKTDLSPSADLTELFEEYKIRRKALPEEAPDIEDVEMRE